MSAKEATFEELMLELEEIQHRLNTGNLPLNEMLTAFERGVEVANRCKSILNDYDAKIEVLTRDNTDEKADE